MDDLRFDNLTRTLSAGISRRRTLSVLGAALASGPLLSTLPNHAAALGRKARLRCTRQGGKICSIDTKRECCSSNGKCLNGACQCDESGNDCPLDATGRCQCVRTFSGASACCDSSQCCDHTTVCGSNAQCTRPGSFCNPSCGAVGECTNPCIPGGSSA
jgi:hypothetical protein